MKLGYKPKKSKPLEKQEMRQKNKRTNKKLRTKQIFKISKKDKLK